MKRLADQTLYEILEVPPDASGDQIQAAYDKARALYGPGSLVTYTLMEPDEAALLEARIEDARGTLLDPERRARYDDALRRPAEARETAAAIGGAAGPAAPTAIALADPPPLPPVAATAGPTPLRPTILLGAALEAAGPADAPAPPRAAPILLRREVPAPPAEAPEIPATPAAAAPSEAEPEVSAPRPAREAPPASPSTPGPVIPPPLPDAWTGDALRQVREARGISVQQISERTKVTRHHIENIEADRFASLPAQVYLRGFLLAIARELRLDGQKVARSYIERLGGGQPPPVPSKSR